MKIFGKDFSFGKPQKTISAVKQIKHTSLDKNTKRIIDAIVEQFKDRSRKDIQKWRKAIQMSEHNERPRMHFIQDLYDDLDTDGHLTGDIELRKNATLNTAFIIIDDNTGQENEEATKLCNQSWFFDFINEALDAIFKGYSLVEFESFESKKVSFNSIPRRNVVPKLKMLFPNPNEDKGISYDDPYFEKWIIQIGKENDLGLLNKIVPNLIWKRNVTQSWATFCQKFGMPMVTANTHSKDIDEIKRIDYMLSQLGELSRGVFPQGTTVDFKEANKTDTYMVYDKFVERNNSEISKALVGGTMLTSDGSSRSQAEVHERNLDDKLATKDKRSIAFLINDYLIPILIHHGYGSLNENSKFAWNKGHGLALDKYWTIVKGVMEENEVDADWLSKTFSIPITGKKKILTKPIALINSIEAVKLPVYSAGCCSNKHEGISANLSASEKLSLLSDQLIKKIWEKKNTLPEEAQILATESTELLKGLHKGWGKRKIEVTYNHPDQLALSYLEFNVFEFASSKLEARLASISELLIDSETKQIRTYKAFENLAKKLTTTFDENYLRTEYNLTVSVSQNSANLKRFMDEKDTVTSLVQYQTVGDSKVRNEHQKLDGQVFSLNDSEAMRILPPNDYGCRCEFIQYLGKPKNGVMKGSEARRVIGENFKNSSFDINRADLNKVFTDKQFYSDVKGLPENLQDMTYNTAYGLKKWNDIKNKFQPLKIDHTITPENIRELFNTDGKHRNKEFMGYTDYLGRRSILMKTDFNAHTRGEYVNEGNRHQLFPHIKDVLNEPDEVYVFNYTEGNLQMKYVKFYKDQALVVPITVRDKVMTIKTWHPLKETEEELVRSGLLIHKKSPKNKS